MALEIEDLEMRDFLSVCPPLRRLNDKDLDALTLATEVSYARRESKVLEPDTVNHFYYLVRSGAVEIFTPDGKIHSHVCEGEWFGYRSSTTGGKVMMEIKALEDTLLYQIPSDVMIPYLEKYPRVSSFFNEKKAIRLRNAISEKKDDANRFGKLSSLSIAELMNPAVAVPPHMAIQDAVKIMSKKNSSSVIIQQKDELLGVVTDHDLRDRVVAVAKNLQTPISDIMSSPLMTIPKDSRICDVQLIMVQNNIQELPVMEGNDLVGVITARDLIKAQGQNPVFLVADIYRATKLSKLHAIAANVPELLHALVNQHLSSEEIGKIVSSIGEAINVRLLQMAEMELGKPPVPYAWGVAGSMARCEQIAHSDQDNALVLSDDFVEEEHGDYFRALAKYVSDGLHACGYIYCPGNVMATNPEWFMTVSQWLQSFRTWIEQPEPKALMYSSIFFDMRMIYGEKALFDPVLAYVREFAPKNSIFLSYMMANSLQHRPPLGFFRNFVLEDHGDHHDVLNLKKRGVIPIVDMARVCGLASGATVVSTKERLKQCAGSDCISDEGLQDLRDAYEVINSIRLQYQARSIENDEEPNNYVSPKDMSGLERRHLKDAFHIVNTFQDSMARHYHVESL
ncbi:MAG: Predicted signal-transduction protein containing cAMP-binding and CBS domains [uncultured Thiotrichaceae bacterium]|uniref:Predicted signal-transduction protein containing cAMP-binding and CBS domains n=1 Tax=uncultured Thiotrichaceae bacterium TaxID=298394 RepID=A0A6S6U7R0_9GAMM|nr:MAG: Predicted signal-transduction protein containing cAMP-binding and CBS domains [uncultured Thiotrichaceae bacterium]